MTQEQFRDRIVEAAERYKAPEYSDKINSNSAAGYLILKAGGTLPGIFEVDRLEIGLRYYEENPHPPPEAK